MNFFSSIRILVAGFVVGNCAAEPVSFKRDIAPVLLSQCQGCHGPKKAKGGYRVDSFSRFAELITAKDLTESEAYQRLVTDDVDDRMPVAAEALPKEQVELFRRWIEAGAGFDGDNPDAPLIEVIPGASHPPAPKAYPRPLPITALAFGPSTNEVIVSGYRELTVWDTTDGSLKRRIGNLPAKIMAVALHPDGDTIAVAGGDPGRFGEVRILDRQGALRQILQKNDDLCLSLAFNLSGTRLAVGSTDGTVAVYSTDPWRRVRTFSNHSDWVNAVSWNADGTLLASASRDHSAKVFDVEKGKRIATYTGHKKSVYDVAFRPGGHDMVSVGADGLLSRWNYTNAKQVLPLRQLKHPAYRFALGDDCVHVISPGIESLNYAAKSLAKQDSVDGTPLAIAAMVADAGTGGRIAVGTAEGEVAILESDSLAVQNRFIAVPGLRNTR